MRKRLTALGAAALVLVLVAVAAVVGVRWWRSAHRSDLQEAMAMAPSEAQRFSWTDWDGVRRSVGADVDADSSPEQLGDFLDAGYDADLTSTSAMVQSADSLQRLYGFSPASVDWELFSQGTSGALVTLHLPDSTDFDELGETLERLGYTRPGSADGLWDGGEAVVAKLDGTISPEFQYVALDAEQHLVRTSDTAGYLRDVLDGTSGDGADPPSGLSQVVDASGEPLSASIYTGENVCSALAMSQADETDQADADELVRSAGKVNPLAGFAIAAEPDGHVRVSMSFENDEQARTNADSRATLAAGPAPGQGGDFSDRFSVQRVEARGRVVTMDLDPVEGSYVLSDLSSGPVVFATC